MGEKAQIMTNNKKFVDDLLRQMTKNHERLSELLREIEEKEEQPG